MAQPSVLLIGASGNFGTPLVQEFLKQKSKFHRIAILAEQHRVQKFAQAQKDGIEIVVGSFLDVNSYRGFDVVLSLAGNAILRLQPAMVELAIAAGVRHFYPSEYGSDLNYGICVNLRYFRDKHVTRNHLAAKAKEVAGFHYTIMTTGPFTEWTVSLNVGVDQEKRTVTAYGRPDAEIAVTSIPDIARYTVESILLPVDPDQSEREIKVAGERTTWQRLIDDLGAVQGVEYQCTYQSREEALTKQEEYRRSGDEASEMAWSLRTLIQSGSAVVPGNLDNDKFSFVPETAKQTFQRIYPVT